MAVSAVDLLYVFGRSLVMSDQITLLFSSVLELRCSLLSVRKFLTTGTYSVRNVLTTDFPLQDFFFYTTRDVEKRSFDSRKLLLTRADLQ